MGNLSGGARKAKGQAEFKRTLYGGAVRVPGAMYAHEVTRKDIENMIMEIVGRAACIQAGNVLRELTAAYEYSIGMGKFDDNFDNSAVLSKASLKQAKIRLTSARGKRVFSDDELTKLLKWLPGFAFTAIQKYVMRFTLWTTCRTGEVCNVK